SLLILLLFLDQIVHVVLLNCVYVQIACRKDQSHFLSIAPFFDDEQAFDHLNLLLDVVVPVSQKFLHSHVILFPIMPMKHKKSKPNLNFRLEINEKLRKTCHQLIDIFSVFSKKPSNKSLISVCFSEWLIATLTFAARETPFK